MLVVLQRVPLALLLVMMKLLLVLLTLVLEHAILEMLEVIDGVAVEEIVLQTTFQTTVLVSGFGCCCDVSLCGCACCGCGCGCCGGCRCCCC